MDKSKLECVDCNPPRSFRSVSGYNGHMQFKHDKTGVFSDRLPGKHTEMIQQHLDQQEHLLNQQDELVKQQEALEAAMVTRQADIQIHFDAWAKAWENVADAAAKARKKWDENLIGQQKEEDQKFRSFAQISRRHTARGGLSRVQKVPIVADPEEIALLKRVARNTALTGKAA